MRPVRLLRLSTVVCCVCFAACAGPKPAAGTDPAAAVARVLAEDSRLGTARNHASEREPLAVVIADYVAALRALDTSDAPPAFVAALDRHADAWSSAIGLFEEFADERGELHAIFDTMGASAEHGERFESHKDVIWSTWAEVEKAAAASRFVAED